ncbi:MAG: hypothetical protein NTW96_24625 [Planctomycetia bacterium]|nr:hypothetical protein [Planctomycetia bacterium]
MSHIVTIKTELRDIAAIKAACKRMGWQLLEGQHTFRWYGRYVGDYREFEKQLRDLGIKTEDYGKCDHAIRVPGAEYEIGLVQRGNRFVPLWDTWGPGGLAKVSHENGMGGFLAAYAVEKAKLEARRKGYTVTEKTLPNGNIQLQVTVP